MKSEPLSIKHKSLNTITAVNAELLVFCVLNDNSGYSEYLRTAVAPSHEKKAMEGNKVSCRAVNVTELLEAKNNMHKSAKHLANEINSMIVLKSACLIELKWTYKSS